MIRACVRQFRVGMAGPVGLDFSALLAMGQALGADQRMLAELLPAVERAALAALAGNHDDEDMTDGGE